LAWFWWVPTFFPARARLTTKKVIRMSSKALTAFNRRVRKWAKTVPKTFYKSALAFGYPCDIQTQEVCKTLRQISDMTRHRNGGKDFVCERTLARHLLWFEDAGFIEVTRHFYNGKRQASTYHVNLPDSPPPKSADPSASNLVASEVSVCGHEPDRDEEKPYTCQLCHAIVS
jgi:hypothetical protein